MAKLRNLRAYVPGTNETPDGISASGYDTGTGNAILRKINLNVDIATQNELNEAFVQLSSAISSSSDGWKAADVQLSNDLKTWATGDALSGALHNEITAETNRATTAEGELSDAIDALTGTYASKLSVEDPYAVTVEKQETAESGYASTYVVKQGGTAVDVKINIPKDFLVKSAELCTVTEAGEPYPEAHVGDKYIDFILNTEDQSETAKHVYLPVNDLVDVYTGGKTDFATVNVDSNRVITVNVSADTISAAAIAAVVGTSEDASSANTIYGAKKYADEVAAAVAVSAQGETGDGALVSANAENNAITVGSTQKLQDAVRTAERAVTYVTTTSDLTGDNILITVSGKTELTAAAGEVYVGASDRLKQVVSKVEAASADWDSAEADAKAYTDTVSAALSTSLHNEITAEATARSAADEFLSGKIDALSTSVNAASGDSYVAATVENNTVKVSATDLTKGAVDKVAAASATWDGALQGILTAQNGQFITTSVGTKTDNEQTFAVSAKIQPVASAVEGEANGFAAAADVKGYVNGKITDLSVSATGDAYVSANSTGKAITVTATNKLAAAVDVIEQTSAAWNAKADLSALTAEETARGNADSALSTAIDNLSGTYVNKTTYDAAATVLNTFSTGAVSALNDYQDIDDIIKDLIALKAAVATFAAATKNA